MPKVAFCDVGSGSITIFHGLSKADAKEVNDLFGDQEWDRGFKLANEKAERVERITDVSGIWDSF